eukprot:356232-Chlamydomonas_euryale.AAC.25
MRKQVRRGIEGMYSCNDAAFARGIAQQTTLCTFRCLMTPWTAVPPPSSAQLTGTRAVAVPFCHCCTQARKDAQLHHRAALRQHTFAGAVGASQQFGQPSLLAPQACSLDQTAGVDGKEFSGGTDLGSVLALAMNPPGAAGLFARCISGSDIPSSPLLLSSLELEEPSQPRPTGETCRVMPDSGDRSTTSTVILSRLPKRAAVRESTFAAMREPAARDTP